MWDSIVYALSGPLLVKLVLAALMIVSFLFLRRKDTEGVMLGYAVAGAFLVLRDLAFAFFPQPDLLRSTDLALFGLLLFLVAKPYSLDWTFWAPAGVALGALVLLLAKSVFGLFSALSGGFLHVLALAPVAVAAILPLSRRGEADTGARILGLSSALPLGFVSLAYIAASIVFGPQSFIAQGLAAPILYATILSLGFIFADGIHGQLVSAVEYYEESVDSLYDLFMAAGAAMKSGFSLQDVLDNTIRAVVERTGADGGILLLADEFEESVSVRAIYGSYPPPFKLPENLPRSRDRVEAFVKHARFKLGEGIFGDVARSGKHVYIASAGPESPLPDNGDEDWLRPGALIVAPLIVRDRIIGAVSVSKPGTGSFTERDFDRCKLLANFASIAIANTFSFLEASERSDIEREASIAEEVQGSLSPKKLPELPGLSFGAFTSPAHGVCSDYYDVIQTKPDRALLAVGDVAGKGVAASLVMVMISSILHLITASTKDAATLLQWVNRGLRGKVDLDHYATLGLIDVDAAGLSLEYSNAGHQSPLVYRAEADDTETVDLKSVPIGVERATSYASTRFELKPGDILVMYTDGIVEAMNPQGKQFGHKNLALSLKRFHDLSAKDIAASIRADLLEFSGQSRQHDDQTVLVMKAKQR